MTDKPVWSHRVSLGEVGRAGRALTLVADEAARKRIARLLDLAELSRLEADVTVSPWFDGVQLDGRWSADLVQTCGVTLEPLPASLQHAFTARLVPPDSVHAPDPEAELVIDLEAEDPPDVIEGDQIDLAAYVVEDLALEIDPFPRKPGVEFEPPKDDADLSPFAVLKKLREPPGS